MLQGYFDSVIIRSSTSNISAERPSTLKKFANWPSYLIFRRRNTSPMLWINFCMTDNEQRPHKAGAEFLTLQFRVQ